MGTDRESIQVDINLIDSLKDDFIEIISERHATQ